MTRATFVAVANLHYHALIYYDERDGVARRSVTSRKDVKVHLPVLRVIFRSYLSAGRRKRRGKR